MIDYCDAICPVKQTLVLRTCFIYKLLTRSSSEAKFTDEIDLDDDVDKTMHIKGQVRNVL